MQGSGTGKAVIAASLLHPFDQAVGIELLEVSGRHTEQNLTAVIDSDPRDTQPLVTCADKRKASLVKHQGNTYTDIEFIEGSLLSTKWENGDVVFCHGTCFNDQYVLNRISIHNGVEDETFME